jgi:hypothetical protein
MSQMKKMKTFATSVVLALAISSISHAQGQGKLSASSLLQGMGNVASNLSRRDAGLGKTREAAIWRQWADLFHTQARQTPPQMCAAELAAFEVNALRKFAVVMEARGNAPAARLYRASAALWQDVANQIARGGEVIVRFPDEFLVVLPGVPGTPWENMQRPVTTPVPPPVVVQPQPNPVATAVLQEAASLDAQSRAVNQLLAQLQANVNANPGASLRTPVSAPPFNAAPGGDAASLINRLNSMSAADVNKLMGQGHWLDQFTPNWLKNAGGNPLAQFGVPNGLMGALGTSDLSRILNPSELDRLAPQLRQAQILGNLAGGMAAEQNIRNQVQSDFYKQLSNKAAFEAKISKIPDEVRLEALLNYIRSQSNPSIH